MQVSAQTATRLHVQTGVNSFVAHPGQLVIGVIAGQHISDQLGAPALIHPRFNAGAQGIVFELETLGRRARSAARA
jgi:hypothetical protein